MNSKLLVIVIWLISLMFQQEGAIAKCAFEEYAITGKVIDLSTGMPISNATLFFFFDDYEVTLSEIYHQKYPDFFFTDLNGNFVARSFFNTHSSSGLFGDICGKKPERFMAVVTASGYLAKRKSFKSEDLNIAKDGAYRIELPVISLTQASRK